MKRVSIYVAMHKKSLYPNNSIYIPIEVGAYNKNKFTKITDDKGDNISLKNSNYCELTATYWIMKHNKSNIVGLVHYRRYFFKKHSNRLEDVLKRADIESILEDYDMIVPNKTYLLKYKNIKEAYCKIHHEYDWNICKEVVLEKYPNYQDSFERIENSRSFYACNMFISKREIFNEYYSWLFDILFEVEKRVDISNYDDYNKRIFGFLAERLFNVFVLYHELRLKEVSVYNVDKLIIGQYVDNRVKKILIHS